jgi:transposase
MGDRSGGVTALLGMDGFVVLSEVETAGEIWMLVETTAEVVGCPHCGVRAVGHGRSVVQVRDLPVSGRPVRLAWRKRRWRCQDPDCGGRSFTETSQLVEGCLTTRAATEVCRLVGEEGRSVASVARTFGVGWHRAWAAVVRHGRPLVKDPRRLHGVRALGVDEHKMLAAGPKHHTVYATQFVDLDSARLLDVVKNRSAASVSSWLDARTRYFNDHVAVAAIDPHAGYYKALSRSLSRATITVDVFHAVKLANTCIDEVRRRVQRQTLGHRGRKDDPLFGIRRLLTRGYERLSDRQLARLEIGKRATS